ncbi:MAG TPA: hypothetical protein VH008_26485, partial [Pseudonocardia sp.]|nr:hypothetical protein [Pseudonocardia sp.]
PWDGPVSWRKPTTFGLSFGLTVLSVTWVASFLRIGERRRAALLGGLLLASVAEVALIDLQAWRRVPSHFNFETPFDTRVTMVLAAGGGVLFVVLGALFVQSLRPQPGLDPELRLAVRLGFGALLAGLAVGGVMIGIGTALVRAGDPQAAYHDAGVFKLAHAVGLHGIAVLPGLAWLTGRVDWPAGARRSVLHTGTAGYLGVLACALWVGAKGGLSSITVFGIALAGSLLVSAAFRVIVATHTGKRVVSESVVR